jgi:hypothetical protein
VGPTLQHSTRLSTFCLAVEAIAFIFMSLAVQGLKKISEKHATHSGPWEALPEV